MQKTQNIPKVASKAIAIIVALILAFAFVFLIGYHLGYNFGKRSFPKLPEDDEPGVAQASPSEPESKDTTPELEQNAPEVEPGENIPPPEKVENTTPPVNETEMPQPMVIFQEQYTVQVGAFRYVSNAERVKELIKSRGYTVWINPPAEDSSLNKVRVGKFDSKNRAQIFGEEIIDFTIRELESKGYPIKREYRVMLIQ